eukprot:365819-Chlamydomonas_euryale.AAC.11
MDGDTHSLMDSNIHSLIDSNTHPLMDGDTHPLMDGDTHPLMDGDTRTAPLSVTLEPMPEKSIAALTISARILLSTYGSWPVEPWPAWICTCDRILEHAPSFALSLLPSSDLLWRWGYALFIGHVQAHEEFEPPSQPAICKTAWLAGWLARDGRVLRSLGLNLVKAGVLLVVQA